MATESLHVVVPLEPAPALTGRQLQGPLQQLSRFQEMPGSLLLPTFWLAPTSIWKRSSTPSNSFSISTSHGSLTTREMYDRTSRCSSCPCTTVATNTEPNDSQTNLLYRYFQSWFGYWVQPATCCIYFYISFYKYIYTLFHASI